MESSLSKPYLILFLGAPGSGKGTQSLLLTEKFDFLRIETSKLLERRFVYAVSGATMTINGKEYSIEEQRKRWSSGILVEAIVVAKTVEEKLQDLSGQGENVILDGFPRTIEQMEYLMPFALEAYGKDRFVVIYLDVEEKDTLFRNSNRRICELVRHPILFSSETEKLTTCPLDGSKLVKRPLDKPKIIKTRLKTFKELTLPLLDYFKEKGINVSTISGKGSVAVVFEHVSKVIDGIIKL